MLYPVATTPLLNDHLEDARHDADCTESQKETPEAHDQRDGHRTEPRSPDAGGESYQDVIQKIRPIIVELERQVGARPTAAGKCARYGKEECAHVPPCG